MEIESAIFDAVPEQGVQMEGFGDFKLLKTTAYAQLYRASKAGKYFLVKTTKDDTERQLAMLHREYELAIGCDHPHIVHTFTYEANLSVGAGVIMEYVEGRTLKEYLAENPSKAERRRIFEELLSAVGYLHKRGVIHNDLKPENILVTHADNRLKLIDFGLADSDAYFALRTLGCTPRYASPELQAQSGVIDARSDIYSVGVLMGDIFGGKHRRIAERCRNAKPDNRYANIEALQLAWKRRNLLSKVLLGAVALVVFFLPLFLFVQTSLEERAKHNAKEKLFAQIESDVEQIYLECAESMSQEVYRDFTTRHFVKFYDDVAKYHAEKISTIPDMELNSLATTVYTLQYSKRITLLLEQSEKLPLTSECNLSHEELLFYQDLIGSGSPYRPYQKE